MLCSVAQSCPTLCDPIDCGPPGSSVHGIFQARILEWVAISYSRGSFQPRDRTHGSGTSCIAGGFFTTESPGKHPLPHSMFILQCYECELSVGRTSVDRNQNNRYQGGKLRFGARPMVGVACGGAAGNKGGGVHQRSWPPRKKSDLELLELKLKKVSGSGGAPVVKTGGLRGNQFRKRGAALEFQGWILSWVSKASRKVPQKQGCHRGQGDGSVPSLPKALVAQSCPTLCDPMDCSPPGSPVCGIFQARIQEWVAIPFSRGSSQPRDGAQVSWIAGRFFTIWATRKALAEEYYFTEMILNHWCMVIIKSRLMLGFIIMWTSVKITQKRTDRGSLFRARESGTVSYRDSKTRTGGGGFLVKNKILRVPWWQCVDTGKLEDNN